MPEVDWNEKRVLVTGGAGFLGSHLVRGLQSRGVKHLGYYPDDFILGEPELDTLRQGISLAEYPRVLP